MVCGLWQIETHIPCVDQRRAELTSHTGVMQNEQQQQVVVSGLKSSEHPPPPQPNKLHIKENGRRFLNLYHSEIS